jgi:hypothetical protein
MVSFVFLDNLLFVGDIMVNTMHMFLKTWKYGIMNVFLPNKMLFLYSRRLGCSSSIYGLGLPL